MLLCIYLVDRVRLCARFFREFWRNFGGILAEIYGYECNLIKIVKSLKIVNYE